MPDDWREGSGVCKVAALIVIVLCWFAYPGAPIHAAEEKVTLPHKLDRPEILGHLFYPRPTGHLPAPAGARDMDVAVADGVTIGCRLFTAAKDAPTILYFHGNGETVPDYDDIAPFYTAQSINFLVADYRGYGWSNGSPAATTMLSDGRVVFRELEQRLHADGYTGKLFVMGRSLGSATAIDLSAGQPEGISGLIIESGFAETIPLAMTLGIDLAKMGLTEADCFNNIPKIEQVTLPILILHGQRDGLIPIWHAEMLHAAAGARTKELQIIPGADHNTMIMTAGVVYFETIRRFVDKVTGRNSWRQNRRDRKKNN